MSHDTERIHVGDVGTVFLVTILEEGTAADLTGYTSVYFKFRKPDGTYLSEEATYEDVVNGVVSYTTQDGDLDIPGRWRLELIVEIPGWRGTTNKRSFFVHENL